MRNWANYIGPEAEKFTLPSMTVPDMSLSVRDLFDRHKNGGRVTTFTPVYADESVPAGLERMDMIDRAGLAKDLSDYVATTRGQLQSRRAANIKAAQDADIEKRVADRVAALTASDQEPKQAEGKSKASPS